MNWRAIQAIYLFEMARTWRTLLQSAIFDIDEMARAIEAWKAKSAADFSALAPVAPV